METVADRAISVRNAIRALQNSASVNAQVDRFEALISGLAEKVDEVRFWYRLALTLDPESRPTVELPPLGEVEGLAQELETATDAGLRAKLPRLVEFTNQMAVGLATLHQECSRRLSATEVAILKNKESARTALRPDLVAEFAALLQGWRDASKQPFPNPDTLLQMKQRQTELQSDLEAAYEGGTEEARAFIGAIVKETSVPLSRLEPSVLEELKASGLANSLVVGMG